MNRARFQTLLREGEVAMAEILAQVFNGLVLGLLFAVMALGFMLVLSVMEVINFSHGALFALGAYFALSLSKIVGYWPALLIAPLIVGGIGLPHRKIPGSPGVRQGSALWPLDDPGTGHGP